MFGICCIKATKHTGPLSATPAEFLAAITTSRSLFPLSLFAQNTYHAESLHSAQSPGNVCGESRRINSVMARVNMINGDNVAV